MATTIGTLVVAGAAVGALYFTNRSLRATNDQYGLAQQTAVTDRFRLAAEQLASEKISVRISGIYLLERLAKDSPTDHSTVFALLGAFVRTQTIFAPQCATETPLPSETTAADIQTALTVIGRRDTANDYTAGLDLRRACLAGANFSGVELYKVDLTLSDLKYANLANGALAGITLTRANLVGADLHGADLSYTLLDGANLTRADLTAVELWNTNLTHATLTDARLIGATFDGTELMEADLTGADLRGAKLYGADLTNAKLDSADLSGILYNKYTRWPNGFTPPPSR
ncbi:pentapeptide repeat-containing protein [Nocardia sp. CA-129566]|uniref:pentapeptide repeat-containing protein n=1 Tax=Nocardia sp. CA-129566 TaxID=3239976 RepID=UPI003D965D55